MTIRVTMRVHIWIVRWRRHWHSAFDRKTRARFLGISRMHRDGLVWMLRHPIRSSRP